LVVHRLAPYTVETETAQAGVRAGIMRLLAHWRWYWLPPLYAVVLTLLLVVTLTNGASTAQFMYGNF